MNHRWLYVTVGGMLFLSACGTPTSSPTGPSANGPISQGSAANLANNCFACHGPNGASPGSIPSIHTFSAEYLAQTLRDFKSGKRGSTVMGRHAKAYTDSEIDAVAHYIAGLQKKRGGAK